MKKTLSSILFGLLTCVALAGCNTVQGVGQDIQQGGKAIERAGNK